MTYHHRPTTAALLRSLKRLRVACARLCGTLGIATGARCLLLGLLLHLNALLLCSQFSLVVTLRFQALGVLRRLAHHSACSTAAR